METEIERGGERYNAGRKRGDRKLKCRRRGKDLTGERDREKERERG